MASILKVTFGITWFILACVFTYKGWFIINAITNLMQNTSLTGGIILIQALYWTGLLIAWTLITVITPIYIIIEGYKEE